MANLLRFSSRVFGRSIHTSVPKKVNVVPLNREQFGSDLEALKQKEAGSWSALSKEDKIALYKSQFPQTLVEANTREPYVMKLVGGVSILVAISIGLFAFLRAYIGPEPPRTLSDDWVAASKEKMIRQRTNPITGYSSKHDYSK